MTPEEKSRILKKIVKCLALANDESATESEAATAAAMAQTMLDKYNLSVADIKGIDKVEAVKSFFLWSQSRWQGWELVMFTEMARIFDCFPYLTRQDGRISSKKVLSVVGFEMDVEVFKYAFEFLRRKISDLALESLGRAKKDGLVSSRRESLDYKNSFCEGCGRRICQRIRSDREVRLSSEEKTQALVLVRKDQVNRWANDNLRLGRGSAVHLGRNDRAREEGALAADRIQLRRGVKSGESGSRELQT